MNIATTQTQEELWLEQARWIRENFKKYKTEYNNYLHVVYIDGIPQVVRGDFIPLSYEIMDDYLDTVYRNSRRCPDCGRFVPKKYSTTGCGTDVWAWVCSCGYESVSFCVDYK